MIFCNLNDFEIIINKRKVAGKTMAITLKSINESISIKQVNIGGVDNGREINITESRCGELIICVLLQNS